METINWSTVAIVASIIGSAMGATWIIVWKMVAIKDALVTRISALEISVAKLAEQINGHPSWGEVENKIGQVLADHEFRYHDKDRREIKRGQ